MDAAVRNSPHGSVYHILMQRLCVLLVVTAITLHVAGCSEQRLAENRAAMRWGRAEKTANAAVHKEQSAPQCLDRTVNRFGRRLESDAVRTDGNASAVDAGLRHEFERWDANQERYRHWIDELLRGKTDTIERNAIILFY